MTDNPKTDTRKLSIVMAHAIRGTRKMSEGRRGLQNMLMKEIHAVQMANPRTRISMAAIAAIVTRICEEETADLEEFSKTAFQDSLCRSQSLIEDSDELARISKRGPDIHPDIDLSKRNLYTLESTLGGRPIVDTDDEYPYSTCYWLATQEVLEEHATYMRSIGLPGQWVFSKDVFTEYDGGTKRHYGKDEGDLKSSDLEVFTYKTSYKDEEPEQIDILKTPLLIFQIHRDLFQGYDRESTEEREKFIAERRRARIAEAA